jgi:LuxR family maltose regulon positive regulatory protein
MRLVRGEAEGVEARLLQAERWLEPGAQAPDGSTGRSTDMIVVDEAAFRRLPGAVSVYRTALAMAHGDVTGTIAHAQRVLDVISADDHLERGSAEGFLALAHWTRGDLEAANRWWTDAAVSLELAGHVSDAIGCSIALADIRIAQGRLHEAMQAYERGISLAARQAAPVLRGVPDMHVGMSELYRERNDLALATQHLVSSEELGEHAGLAQNPYRWHVAMARVREAEGDLDAALELLDEAERLYASDYYPNVRPIPAMKARIWIAQGRLSQALGWARAHGVSVKDELSYVREFDHITPPAAAGRSDRTGRPAREAPGSWSVSFAEQATGRSVIEILVLQAPIAKQKATRRAHATDAPALEPEATSASSWTRRAWQPAGRLRGRSPEYVVDLAAWPGRGQPRSSARLWSSR